MLKLLTGAFCAVAGVAVAQDSCLTNRDLSRGIQMFYEEGDFSTLTRGRDGLLELVETYSDGTRPVRFQGAYALYLESEVELDGGQPIASTLLEVDFGQPSTDLPAPTPGGSFNLATINRYADGSEQGEEYSASFGPLTTLDISGCQYDAIAATLRYAWPSQNDGMTVEYIFLPEIGAAFLTASQFDGQDRLIVTPARLERRQK